VINRENEACYKSNAKTEKYSVTPDLEIFRGLAKNTWSMRRNMNERHAEMMISMINLINVEKMMHVRKVKLKA
jgi:hypothetical protein